VAVEEVVAMQEHHLELMTCTSRPDLIPSLVDWRDDSCSSRESPRPLLCFVNGGGRHGQSGPAVVEHRITLKMPWAFGCRVL